MTARRSVTLLSTLCRRAAIGVVALIAGLIAGWPTEAIGQDVITIGSQQGQQIFFDITRTRTYNFGITTGGAGAGITFGSMNVSVKGGNAASNVSDVILYLYQGLGGTGTLLASGTLPASALTNDFAAKTVTLNTPVTLGAGGYSVRLVTANTTNYYIKEGKLTLTSTTGTVLSNTVWIEDSNADGTASTTLTASGTVLAQPLLSGSSVSFGNYRVTTGTLTQSLSLANSALVTSNNVTQALAASASPPAAISVSGLPSPSLAASATTSVTVGLNRSTVGPTKSNVAVAFQSVPGASATTGTTAIGNGTIAVSGTGWRAATLNVSSTSVHLGKFHVGASNLSGVATVSNTSTADGYSEGLAVIASGSSGGATVTNAPGLIAAGGNGSIGVGLGSVSAVGQNGGTVTLDFESSGQGTSGLANLGLGSRVINVSATGYSGQAAWNVDTDGQWNTFASWDEPGGKPGVDGALSTNDTATFGSVATANRQVRLNGANPVLAALTFSNSTARYTIAPGSGGSLTLGTSHSAAAITNAAGSHSIAADIALARATSVETAHGSVLTLAGGLSGAHALTKTGLGELAITGIGSLSGTTTVAAGVLRLNGSIAASDLTVEQGATLMGSGTVGNTVVYGTHSPGNSPDVQAISGDLAYQGGSSVLWELVANTVSGRGTNYDGIDVTGGLTFSGTTALDLSFNFTGSTVDWSDSFWATSHSGTSGWLVYDGATSLTGFANLMISGTNWADSQGNMLQTARAGATFSTFQDGNNVYLVYAVPEPATWALLATAAAAAWPFVRRRRAVRP